MGFWDIPILFVTLITSLPDSLAAPRSQNDPRFDFSLDLLHDVLNALEKASNFLAADYASINVDGLFGIRLAQGNVVEAVRFCERDGTSCPPGLQERLLSVNQTISVLGDKALPYVMDQDPQYFSQFQQTIDSPYTIPYKPVSIEQYRAPGGHDKHYGEEAGDVCLSSVMGTFVEEKTGRTLPRCTVTDACWELMTRPDQRQYSITHQLLFFIVGEKAGCLEELNQEMASRHHEVTSVKEQEKVFCGQILSEMEEETELGDVRQLDQDLFLEQSVLCGTLGFREMFQVPWIRMVLRWQNAQGCFSMPAHMIEMESQLQNAMDAEKILLERLEQEAAAIDRSMGIGRKLLREKVMQDDCLAHKSGLGYGVLGAYLRFLLQSLYTTS